MCYSSVLLNTVYYPTPGLASLHLFALLGAVLQLIGYIVAVDSASIAYYVVLAAACGQPTVSHQQATIQNDSVTERSVGRTSLKAAGFVTLCLQTCWEDLNSSITQN